FMRRFCGIMAVMAAVVIGGCGCAERGEEYDLTSGVTEMSEITISADMPETVSESETIGSEVRESVEKSETEFGDTFADLPEDTDADGGETLRIGDTVFDINEEEVFFYNVEGTVTDEDVKQLSRFPNLRRFGISFLDEKCQVTDLSPLKELETLESLFIDGTYEDMSFLAGMPRLKTLELNRFVWETLENVPEMPSVEEIRFDNVGMEDLSWIVNFTNLEKLSMGHSEIKSMEKVGEAVWLKELNMSMMCLGDDDFSFLGNLASLEVLRISTPSITAANAKNFSAVAKCTELKVLDAMIYFEDLEFCRGLKNLENITLYGCSGDTEYDLSPLADCRTLKSADLSFHYKAESLDFIRQSLTDCEITTLF
ncbi:MAG: hypothetical protein NC120_14175, partial [Ruminococcus sp.]|nr:hypothetical protein [Ruminococcus sp.]